MKRIKRVLIITLSLLLGIVIGLYIYLQIRDQASNRQLVHKDSSAILKVAVDDIAIDMLSNVLINPSMWQGSSTSDSTKVSGWTDGIKIPANIYFFSIGNQLNDLYTYQKLKDEAKFLDRLLSVLHLDSSAIHSVADYWYVQSANGKISFMGNKDNVLVGLSSSSGAMLNKMQTIWAAREQQLLPIDKLQGFNGSTFDSDMLYVNLHNQDTYRFNFSMGKINVEAKVDAQAFGLKASSMVRKMDKDNILSFYCQADIGPFLAQRIPLFANNEELRNFLMYSYAGYVDLQWKKGQVVQQDTIIAYDYDDNFEPVEIQEVREELVPNLLMTIKGKSGTNDQIPDKLFYKVTKTVDKDYIILRTALTDTSSLLLEPATHFLSLQYNYDEAVKEALGSLDMLKGIKSIVLTGKEQEGKYAFLSGEIKLLESSLHPLLQLF